MYDVMSFISRKIGTLTHIAPVFFVSVQGGVTRRPSGSVQQRTEEGSHFM